MGHAGRSCLRQEERWSLADEQQGVNTSAALSLWSGDGFQKEQNALEEQSDISANPPPLKEEQDIGFISAIKASAFPSNDRLPAEILHIKSGLKRIIPADPYRSFDLKHQEQSGHATDVTA